MIINQDRLLDSFLRLGLDPNTSIKGCTLLYTAVDQGKKSIAQVLLKAGAKANHTSKDRHEDYTTSPLIRAAWGCLSDVGGDRFFDEPYIDCVELLVRSKANVDAVVGGTTALCHAAFRGIRTVDKLIELGASKPVKDEKGRTPLHIAAYRGFENVVAKVADKGNINEPDKDGLMPAHLAIQYGHVELTQLLLTLRADVSGVDRNRRTLLHTAAYGYQKSEGLVFSVQEPNPFPRMIEMLLERKADAKLKDGDGRTSLDVIRLKLSGQIKTLNPFEGTYDEKAWRDAIIAGNKRSEQILAAHSR